MKVRSLVEYVGGQDPPGRRMFRLERNIPYTVGIIGICDSLPGRKTIELDEIPGYSFIIEMFKEIQPPQEVSFEEIVKENKVTCH